MPCQFNICKQIINPFGSVQPRASGRQRSQKDAAALAKLQSSMPNYSAGTVEALLEGAFGGNELQVDAAEHTIRAIASGLWPVASEASEAVLVFLPGVGAIRDLHARLCDDSNVFALPLHASMSADEQRAAFAPPPKGKRKVLVFILYLFIAFYSFLNICLFGF